MIHSVLSSKWTKIPVFFFCLAPLGWLVWDGVHHRLGANPIEFITHVTGEWTLIFLLITLTVTPARKLLRQPALIRFRRMLGLFAFFYGSLHFATYIGLDQFFDLLAMMDDISQRKFITVGLIGFLLLVPLTITSTAGGIRRLGGRRWQVLHRLVYVSAAAGVVHYYWLVKSDVTEPVRYGLILALLLLYRIVTWIPSRQIRLPSYRSTNISAPRTAFDPEVSHMSSRW